MIAGSSDGSHSAPVTLKVVLMPRPPSPAPLPASLKWRAYGLVRPLVRPIARRVRMFLVGRLHDEIAELRAEVKALREAVERPRVLESGAVDQHVREVMAQALATLALDREPRP